MQNKTNKLKSHLPFLIIISLLAVFSFPDLLTNRCISRGDIFSDFLPANKLIKESFIEHKQMPLWDHRMTSGVPFLAVGQRPIFYPVFVVLILLFDYCAATNLSILFAILFSGITAYLMMIYLKFKREIALISAIIYMFNSYTLHWAYAPLGFGTPYLPLIFITLSEAIKSKNWVLYSLLSALLFSLVFHAGSVFIFLYFFVFFGLFLLFKLLEKLSFKRLLKLSLIGSLVILSTLGLCAVKLLPSLEFVKVTNRAEGFDYERSRNPVIPLKDYPKSLFKGGVGISETTALVGIMIIPFLFLSLLSIKKKKVLFFWIVLVFALVLVGRNQLYYLFWRFVPGFKLQRHVWRSMVLFTLSCSILAGVGLSTFYNYLKNRFKLGNKQLFIIFIIIALLFFMDLTIFKGWDLKKRVGYLEEKEIQFKNIELLQYVTNDEDISRLHFNEVTGIGFSINPVIAYRNTELLYGLYGNIWVPEYINLHLSYAMQDKAKFWGMLNVKYLSSTEKINISGFEFVDKFEECKICTGMGEHIDGPYLYRNSLFLPRAYVAERGILVVGDKEAVQQLVYSLMLIPEFNPANTVVISGDRELINSYEIKELEKFDLIVLTQGSINQESHNILDQYVKSGGIILPNVLQDEFELDLNTLKIALKSFEGDYSNVKKAEITYYSPNEMYIDVQNKEGFLVYSERFPVFGGWRAYIDRKESGIMRADGIIASVPIEKGSKELRFIYKPTSFKIGLAISAITLIIILWVIVYHLYKKKKLYVQSGI